MMSSNIIRILPYQHQVNGNIWRVINIKTGKRVEYSWLKNVHDLEYVDFKSKKRLMNGAPIVDAPLLAILNPEDKGQILQFKRQR